MDRQDNAAPVIIRKKKVTKQEGGHHGGAWKVAYADFVTAMMAFFLIMWLLNATTESQRRGLADYFSPSLPVNRVSGGGDGAFGGDNPLIDGDMPLSGEPSAPEPVPAVTESAEAADSGVGSLSQADEAQLLSKLRAALSGQGAERALAERALRHMVTRVTDEGLIVEIFDLPGEPLFTGAGDEPTPVMRAIADLLAEVFAPVANGLAIEGHTRAYPVVLNRNPVWDLSIQRAERTRTLLSEAGLPADRTQRVTGHADRHPATPNPPMNRNNRLEIILLRDPS